MEWFVLKKMEIDTLRKKLNKSIEKNEDYSVIYNLSIQLDDLIAKYYKENCTNLQKYFLK